MAEEGPGSKTEGYIDAHGRSSSVSSISCALLMAEVITGNDNSANTFVLVYVFLVFPNHNCGASWRSFSGLLIQCQNSIQAII